MDWFDASTAAAAMPASDPKLGAILALASTAAISGCSGESWGGWAQADSTLVGVVVAAIAIFAVAHVLERVLGERRPGARGGARPQGKPARARSR